jgi:hypothetical protein
MKCMYASTPPSNIHILHWELSNGTINYSPPHSELQLYKLLNPLKWYHLIKMISCAGHLTR